MALRAWEVPHDRLDNGRVHWLDFDPPDAIELRRHFVTDQDAEGRRTTRAASVLDPAWQVLAASELPGPYFLAAEAVLPFLTGAEVRAVLTRLAERFPGALLATELVRTFSEPRQAMPRQLAATAGKAVSAYRINLFRLG